MVNIIAFCISIMNMVVAVFGMYKAFVEHRPLPISIMFLFATFYGMVALALFQTF